MSLSVDIKKEFGGFRLETAFETDGDILGILGASGCGKSMTLRCIAGIVRPDEGRIVLNGVPLFDSAAGINLPPQERRVGYLFQNYGLFPNMTVEQNILCGLHREKDKRRRKKAAAEMIGRMKLEGLETRRPAQLSGGQQQRVALARILAGSPEILMLDEPFSALDAYLRVQIQTDMQEWLREFGKDVLLVSHNRDEIYRLCGSLAVMDRGRILGKGPVKQMFRSPGSRQGAVLTGCRNIVEARKAGEHLAEVPAWGLCLETEEPLRDDLCAIGIRAHYFSPEEERNSGAVVLEGEMEEPFEWILKFRYETAAPDSRPVWWRIPKERRPQHFPKRLGIAPEQVMPLYR